MTTEIRGGAFADSYSAACVDLEYWEGRRKHSKLDRPWRRACEDEEVDAMARNRLATRYGIPRAALRECCPEPRKTELLHWNWRVILNSAAPSTRPPKARRPRPSSSLERLLGFLRRSIRANHAEEARHTLEETRGE